jgi:hypothetical protein
VTDRDEGASDTTGEREMALGDAAFLARSPNRLAVLDVLDTSPAGRNEIGERAGVERVTLGRVLEDAADRGWVREGEDGYALTATGAWVRDAFDDLLGSLAATRRLAGLVEFLPADLPVRALRDAEVVRPSPGDPTAPLRRAEQHTRETTHQRVVTDALAPGVLEAMHAGVTGGDLRLEAVLGPSMLSVTATAPETRALFGDLLATEATSFRTGEGISLVLGIHDPGVGVGIGVVDESGIARALIESDAPAVREWAVDTFERRWHDADPVDPGLFDTDE